MASSDDEGDTFPDAVSDYYFNDGDDEPLSFSNLPVQWDENESLGTDVEPVFLSGTVDKGLGKTYQQVKAWKYDSLSSVPVISVLSKDNRWIKLQKPRKSYTNLIRTILITVHSIGFCKTKPEASGKSLWDHLSKVFSLYDVRPSENDLIEHTNFIREAVKRDATLAKSKFLTAFLENPIKRKLSDEVVGTATKPSFIVDDTNGDLRDDDFITKETEDSGSKSDDEADHFDSVCAICDNGGVLLCCDGKCFRSFHKTREGQEAQESKCDSLCLSPEEVKETEKDGTLYYCENCRYNLHQCFACGELGSSDKSSNTEVFRCSAATCGHFYHPKCVAKLLQKDNEADPQALEEKIAGGDPFTCPAHKCAVCKQTENEKVEELQFAVCRRCPTSYHRKCIPRSIMFDDEGDDDSTVRAWDNLLPKSRALMYCMKHKIIKGLWTPARTLKVRNILRSKTGQPSVTPKNKKKAAVSEFASKKKPVLHQLKGVQKSSAINLEGSVKKRAATSSVPVPSKKKKVADTSNNSLRRSVPTKVKKPSLNDGQPSLGIRLYEYQKGLESNNSEEDATPATDSKQNMIDNSSQTEVLPPIDEDSKQRILALMKDAASSITLDEVKKYHIGKVPSTHTSSSRVDKSIILARVEGSVEAIHVALKKLEEGCSVEDAMAVCDPGVLDQIMKWKEKLRVYLAPFLHGMRYTSFGRHFTKVDKLEKIVDKLKWYVEDGDTVVDFCCGANDFSCLMKNRLDEMGKKRCTYKNFDITRPKNDFNYEKRDWMTVGKTDLPVKGSRLIMGLNPPFGKNATLANQFIAHALLFKPKLVILIVPPETQRLDSEKKRNPYDLIWEDVELLAGKSFYLPGSVDVNDKQMEQWNNTPPPLYLWSRRDWTTKHKNIAQRQGHIPNVQRPPQSNEKMPESGLATVNNEISEDLTATLDAPIINEVEDLEKMTDKAKPDTKKRKKGSVAHDNGGLETKNMPIKEKSKDVATTLDAPVINEVKDLEKMTDKAKPDTKRRKKGSVAHDNGLETKNMPIKEKSVQNSSKKKSHNQESKIEKRDDNHSREVEAQKPDEKRAPSREVKDQKLDETRAQPREIEPQKLDKNRAPSREDQTQKHEKNQDLSREDQAQKHDKTRAPSRDIQSQKPDNKHSRAPSRDNEAQKAPIHKDEVSETQDSDFSFVDDVRRDLLDQNLDKKYNIDESTFSFQNDIGTFDPHMDRRYNPTNDDSYVSSVYRRPDTANHASSTYLTRHDHGQYSSGYDRVGRGSYLDDMGSRGSYSVTHNEHGLARYGSVDATPYNRTSSSTMQRYAPKLDELNHTRPNSLGQPGPSAMQRYEPRLDEMNHPRMIEVDHMNHMNHMNHARMNSLGQSEPIMGGRSVGGYGPPGFHSISGPPPGFHSDSMGFATGPYHPHPQQHSSSGGWLNE
ncbi:protein enhanced downy mildew 2 isoform X1 [Tanacetum coccineum]